MIANARTLDSESPPTKVYLAGKIRAVDDWRLQIFRGIGPGDEVQDEPEVDGFLLAGPYFQDVGGNNTVEHGPGPSDSSKPHNWGDGMCGLAGLCFDWIGRSEVVFAYIDGDDPFGTILEIGVAAGQGKPVFLAYETNLVISGGGRLWKETHLARDLAQSVATFDGPLAAWDWFVGAYSAIQASRSLS